MVQRVSPYLLGGIDVVLGFLCRHHHLVEGQGADTDLDFQVQDVLGKAYLPVVIHITKAGNIERIAAGLDVFHRELAIRVRHRPQIVIVELYDGTCHGLSAAGVQHLAFQFDGAGCQQARAG